MYWDNKHYKQAISIIKEATNKPISGVDSTDIGNKYTECSIGLCSPVFEDKSNFPPYRKKHHLCPLDMRQDYNTSSGCFYHCAYFSSSKNKTSKSCKDLVIDFKIKEQNGRNSTI